MDAQSPQHLKQTDQSMYWDWWRENPVEIILVILIIVLFATVPWEGCGVSEQPIEASDITIVP